MFLNLHKLVKTSTMYNGSASAVEKLSENSIKWVDSIYNILSIQIMYLSQQLAIIYQSQANIGGKRIYKLIVLIIRHSFLHYFDTNFNWIFDSNSNYCNTNKNFKFSKLQVKRKTERALQSINYSSCNKTFGSEVWCVINYIKTFCWLKS